MPNDNLQPDTVKKDRKKQSRAAEIWKRFRRSKLAMVGFVIIVTVVLLAAFASVICDYEADARIMMPDFWGPPCTICLERTIMAATFLPVCSSGLGCP